MQKAKKFRKNGNNAFNSRVTYGARILNVCFVYLVGSLAWHTHTHPYVLTHIHIYIHNLRNSIVCLSLWLQDRKLSLDFFYSKGHHGVFESTQTGRTVSLNIFQTRFVGFTYIFGYGFSRCCFSFH